MHGFTGFAPCALLCRPVGACSLSLVAFGHSELCPYEWGRIGKGTRKRSAAVGTYLDVSVSEGYTDMSL